MFPQHNSSAKWEGVGKINKLRRTNVFLSFKYHFVAAFSLFLSISLSPPLSNKDTGTFLLHYPRPAEVSFHVLPRPVVCQVARCQAGLSLPTHPPSCRLNNAICHSPLTIPVPFTLLSQRLKDGTARLNPSRVCVLQDEQALSSFKQQRRQ